MCLIGVGLFFVAPADARSHLAATLHLTGTHGYGVSVIAHRAGLPLGAGKAGKRVGKVTVIARRGSETASSAEGESASYTVPGKFNKHRIRADMGKFGEVRLRFHKRPRVAFPKPYAADKRRIGICSQFGFTAPGEFRGIVRFRGEGGYTRVRSHRAHGQFERDTPIRCTGHEHGTLLQARSGSTKFIALADTDFGVTGFFASTRERSGRVDIARDAYRIVPLDSGEFTFNRAWTRASVAPGGDLFTGSAGYAWPDDWTGSLAVSFPGREDVPLAGPDFSATLGRGSALRPALFTR